MIEVFQSQPDVHLEKLTLSMNLPAFESSYISGKEERNPVIARIVAFNFFVRFSFSLSENSYRVHVFTGDVPNAGTNSNVFLCLFGELGDSGERKLEKSETHMDKFERNNVRPVVPVFTLFYSVSEQCVKLTTNKFHRGSCVFLCWYLLTEAMILQVKRCSFMSMQGTFCTYPVCSRCFWILFLRHCAWDQALTGPERGTVKDLDPSPGINTIKSNPVKRRNFGL